VIGRRRPNNDAGAGRVSERIEFGGHCVFVNRFDGVEQIPMNWLRDMFEIGIAMLLVALNGFFVAAEFALVKIRVSQIEQLVEAGRPFAKTARWLAQRVDESLSACQLGITMASLALGWVGEPAFAHLLRPLFVLAGIESERVIHALAFTVAFTFITALHLVIGEQAPKIFAIRRPDTMILWCAAPLKFFYVVLYPFLALLNLTTSFVLARLGLKSASEHETPHTEEEIRALLREAHIHGNVTGAEHRLINAVFEFDDIVCRRVMVPRGEVDALDVNDTFAESLKKAKEAKHTRYPLCDRSLDKLLGVVHMKDLLGVAADSTQFDLRKVMRPPRKVPENMPISRVLRHFQKSHQLLAFVVDEYGTIIGIVTLENVLEKIVGPVDDEFDLVQANVKEDKPGEFIVLGSTPIEEVEKALNLNLDDEDVDTLAGVLMSRAHKLPEVDDRIEFEHATAQILEVKGDHAELIRIVTKKPEDESSEATSQPEPENKDEHDS
jgi:CBS domain containing-hemolysin-like protein